MSSTCACCLFDWYSVAYSGHLAGIVHRAQCIGDLRQRKGMCRHLWMMLSLCMPARTDSRGAMICSQHS